MTDQQFVPLAQRYMDTIFRVAYSYLRSRSDADDVTQEVLIQLYKTDIAFENDAHLKRWLLRVTVNRCKNIFRSPWRRLEDITDYENSLTFDTPEHRELFDAVILRAAVCAAAAPAVPVHDTIKLARDRRVTETPDRSMLFAVQTPQVFDAGLLKAALQSALTEHVALTDDCSAVERLGKAVYLTDGDEENIKITTPLDLIVAETILRRREEREAEE